MAAGPAMREEVRGAASVRPAGDSVMPTDDKSGTPANHTSSFRLSLVSRVGTGICSAGDCPPPRTVH